MSDSGWVGELGCWGGDGGGRSCGLRKWVRGDVGGGLGGNVMLPLLEPQIFQYRYRYLRILLVAV